MSKDIAGNLKKIVGTHKIDVPYIVLAIVNSVDTNTLTCTCTALSGLSVNTNSSTGGNPINYVNNIGFNGKTINSSDVNNSQTALVYENVALMSGGSVADGIVHFPAIGSMVTIFHTKHEQAFIIHYSSIDIIQMVSQGTITTFDNLGMYVSTNNAKSEFIFEDYSDSSSPGGVQLAVNNNATNYTQTDTQIDLKTATGGEITIADTIAIKNNITNLNTILSNMNNAISQIAVLVESLTAPNPALDALIAEITVQITALLSS